MLLKSFVPPTRRAAPAAGVWAGSRHQLHHSLSSLTTAGSSQTCAWSIVKVHTRGTEIITMLYLKCAEIGF